MIKTQSKTKTQITINDDLSLIVSMIKQKYPIFDTNQTIEFLIAKGCGAYLDEVNLTNPNIEIHFYQFYKQFLSNFTTKVQPSS